MADPIAIATVWHYIQRVCRETRSTVDQAATESLRQKNPYF